MSSQDCLLEIDMAFLSKHSFNQQKFIVNQNSYAFFLGCTKDSVKFVTVSKITLFQA